MDKKIIKQIRETMLLTQKEFSEEIKVSLSTIQEWEWGLTIPSFKHQRKILEFCKKHEIDIGRIKEE